MNEADPRVKRTRKLLEEAFVALLAEKSFRAITIQDITERATLNRATFYAHFEDKYALLDYMIGERFHATLDRRVTVGAPLTLGNLQQLVVAVCEFQQEFHSGCHGSRPTIEESDLRLSAKVQQELYTYLLGWITRAQLAQSPSNVRPETAALLASWAIFGAGMEWGLAEHKSPVDEWARQVVGALGEGVLRKVEVPDALDAVASSGVGATRSTPLTGQGTAQRTPRGW